MDLRLDSDDETIPLTEDISEEKCVLCESYNYDYLLELHSTLVESTNTSNMYDILYKTFLERMNLLKRQQMAYVEISKSAFINHFENHL